MTRFEPIGHTELIATVHTKINRLTGPRVVAIDAADAASPVTFAIAVSDYLQHTNRACAVVDLHSFIRPASLRLEYGRHDEYSYKSTWFDYPAIQREIIDPLSPEGDLLWLPALWEETTDRSARAKRIAATPNQVIIIAGPMLRGRHLKFDFTVYLHMSESALHRNTPPEQQWTIPAVSQYYSEITEEPDLLVKYDHSNKPAIATPPEN
ncbi:MAG: hypothetical protein ACRCSF_07370 [Mycobacteriaceae bacterium]